MKRLFTLILVLISIATLTACGGDRKNEKAFKKYLESHDGITKAELSELLKSSEQTTYPEDFFKNLKVNNIQIKDKNNVSLPKVYVWQNEDKVYFADYDYLSDTVDNPMYLDLAELEGAYDANNENSSGELDLVEQLEQMIDQMIEASNLSGYLDIDLEDILSLTNWKYDDFDHEGDGVYVVNNDAIYHKIEMITDGMITKDHIKLLLAQSGLNLKFTIHFDGDHIDSYKLLLDVKQQGMTITLSLELKLNYSNDNINGFEIKFEMPGASIRCAINALENGLKAELELSTISSNGMGYENIYMEFLVTDSKLKVIFKNNNTEVLNLDLNYSIQNNQLSVEGNLRLGVEQTIGNYEFKELTITSGLEINIPQKCKDAEKNAGNILESGDSSMDILPL